MTNVSIWRVVAARGEGDANRLTAQDAPHRVTYVVPVMEVFLNVEYELFTHISNHRHGILHTLKSGY